VRERSSGNKIIHSGKTLGILNDTNYVEMKTNDTSKMTDTVLNREPRIFEETRLSEDVPGMASHIAPLIGVRLVGG